MAATDERTAWIALASVEGLGDVLVGRLLDEFGSARAALAATLDGRVAAWLVARRHSEGRPPFGAVTLEHLRVAAADPQAKLDAIAERGLWTLTALDTDYPARLRDLDPPPMVIHGHGERDLVHRPRLIAVVGTRRPTPHGRLLATRVAARLVECQAVVVSGLAVGIDGAAQAATIEHDGATVGVIGGGHDHPGPRAHARLRAEVASHGGAVISEYFPTTQPRKGTYPRRNRIIAALADATIVIEAPSRSGARITASLALELGRPVLVAPGRVGDHSTAGSLAILRETPARPLVGLDEMVEDLGYLAPSREEARDSEPDAQAALYMLGNAEQAIARRLTAGPAGLDALVVDTGLSPAVVSSAVTLLLMRGWAQSAGVAYIAAGPLAK